MKKVFLIVILGLTTYFYSNAQEVGVRFGGTNGHGGAAVDAVFGTGPNRIHADAGFYNGGVGLDVLWDFIYKPINQEAFNWYLGAGPTTYIGNDAFWLGVCGEVGLEYRFSSVPISLGADWRPTLWIIDETSFGADSFGLNVRFRF